MKFRTRFAATAAAALSLSAAASAGAATAPLLEDYNDGQANGFTTGTNASGSGKTGTYTPTGSAYQAVVSSDTGGAAATSAVQVTNIAGTNFRVETDFTISSFSTSNGSTLNLGLGLLGASADLGTTATSQYRVLFTVAAGSNVGLLAIQEGSTGRATSTDAALAVTTDVAYHLAVDVTYSGATPTLSASVWRVSAPGTTNAVAYTDSTPQAGQYFGYRTAVNAGAGGAVTETIDYDNFAVTAIPEPGAVGLAATAAGLLLRRRRR